MIHVSVITCIMVEILFFLFLVIQILICSGKNGDPTVICVFRQSCILPCNVDPSSDTVIHWDHLTSGEHNVHSYYTGQDQLGLQDQQVKGRTSLFKDLISRGNASLKLTAVKIQDEGRYRCYSSTERGSKKTFIQLKVEAPITEIIIKQIGNRVICYSEGIYPQPELTWSVNPPSELKIQNRTTVHQTEEQLYNISSSLTVSDKVHYQTYSCTVSSDRNTKTVYFHKRKVLDTTSRVISIILGLCPPCLLIFGLIGSVCCSGTTKRRFKTAARQQLNRAANQQNSTESERLQMTSVFLDQDEKQQKETRIEDKNKKLKHFNHLESLKTNVFAHVSL